MFCVFLTGYELNEYLNIEYIEYLNSPPPGRRRIEIVLFSILFITVQL